MESKNILSIDKKDATNVLCTPVNITSTYITNDVLQRFTYIMGMDKEKQHMRNIVLNQFNTIPAWKKRGL